MKTTSKNTYAKRAVSLLLSFVMLLSVAAGFPANAFADAEINQFNCAQHLKGLGVNLDSFEQTIRNAVLNKQSKVDLSSYNIGNVSNNYNAIYYYISTYMIELLTFVGVSFSTKTLNFHYDSVYDISVDYPKIVQAKDKLLDGIINNDTLTDVEKALLVHDRLCAHAEYTPGYDYDAAYSSSSNVYGALVKRICVCSGYAAAYQYLMNELGIDTFYVSCDIPDHAWNIVMIDNVPYYVDCTWDDGGLSRVDHDNFLLSLDGIIATGHCDSEKKPRYVTSVNGTKINDKRYENMYWKNSKSEFRLVDNKIYYIDNEAGTLNIADKNNTVLCKIPNKSESSNEYSRLSSCSDGLLFSTEDSIYKYDINSKTVRKIYTPNKSENKNIEPNSKLRDFIYEDNYLYCYFLPDGKRYYQVNIENYVIKHYYKDEVIPQASYSVIINNDEKKGTVSGDGEYEEGTYITLTAKNKKGYQFDGFYCNNKLLFSDEDDLNNVSLYVNENMQIEARYSVCTHSYEEKVLTTPTCKRVGRKQFKCKKCGDSYYEDMPIVEHSFVNGFCEFCDLQDVNYAMPEIAVPGNIKVRIAKAGSGYYAYFIPQISGMVTVSSSGDYDTYGYLYDKDMNVLIEDDDSAENGNFSYSYFVEGKTKYIIGSSFNNIKKTGSFGLNVDFNPVSHNHIYTQTVLKQATCTENGTIKYKCTLCDNEFTEIIPALGHTFNNNLCTICGSAKEYEYTVVYGVATITKYNGSASNLTLPVKIDGYAVKSVGNTAFVYSEMVSLTIPEGYTSIGESAFFKCQSLKSVSFPTSLESLDRMAFGYCDSLETVYIPKNVSSIDPSAFSLCRKIRNATVSPENTTYDSRINCNAIIKTADNELVCGFEDTVIPHSVVSIASKAFGGTWSESVRIPKSVKHIGFYAFTYDDYNSGYYMWIGKYFLRYDATARIQKVYYEGSEDEWKQVIIDPGNENITNASIQYNTPVTVCKNHTYDCRTITKQPTCKRNGVVSYICSTCGDTYSEALPKIAHNYINGSCEFCGEYDFDYSIPEATIPYQQKIRIVSKDYYNYSFTPKKDCKVIIYTKREKQNFIYNYVYDSQGNSICRSSYNSELGYYILIFFAVKGRNYRIKLQDYYPSCGEFTLCVDYDYSAGHIHEYTETVEKAATCTESGTSKYVCSICGDTVNETVPALGHSFNNNTCTRCSTKEYEYSIDNKNIATITKYNGNSDKLVLPTKIEGYATKHIGDSAFSGSSFSSLTIPEGYESIGYLAFGYCNALKKVELPESLKSINNYAFYLCSGLEELYIPKNVETIYENPFECCYGLNRIIVDENNKKFDSRNNSNAIIETASGKLISGCKNTSIPHSVTSIGDYAFYRNFAQEITIPKSVKSIGNYAFYSYYDSDVISDVYYTGSESEWNKISIGTNNEKLTSADIHFNTVVAVCENHKYSEIITKQPTCTETGTKTFICDVCGNTYNEALPQVPHNYVNGYCEYCFENDPNYTIPEITLPYEENIRMVKDGVYHYVYVTPEKNGKIIVYTSRKSNNYIKSSVYDNLGKQICSGSYNYSLNSYSSSFFAVKGRKYRIELWDYYRSSGAFTLYVEYDNTEGHIHEYTETVEKAATCTDSGTSKYVCSICGDTVSETVPALGHSFNNNTCTRCSTKEYEYSLDSKNIATITKYNGNSDKLVLPTKIEGYMVKGIGQNAFNGCLFLDLTIPEGYETIGGYGISYCYNLKALSLPKSLRTIDNYAFYSCNSLEKVNIPENVQSLGINPFAGCRMLKNITVDEDNKNFDSRNNCNAIIETASGTLICGCKNTSIPHSVTSIGDYAFYGGGFAQEITIPKSVKSIDNYAFYTYYDSDVISDVYYTGSESEWNKINIGTNNEKLTSADIHFNTEITGCENHKYSEIITKQPTCTETGTKTFICDICGNTYNETLPKVPHNYINGYCEYCFEDDPNYTIPEITVPFEDTVRIVKGGTYYYVSFTPEKDMIVSFSSTGDKDTYGYIYDENMEVLSKNDDGGDNSNFSVVYSLKKDNLYYFACKLYSDSNTGSFDVSVIDVTDTHKHTIIKDVGYPATCSKEGLTEGTYCEVCGETIQKAQVIPKKEHTPAVYEGYPATCEYEGLTDEIYCSVCYETIEEAQVIPKAAHTPVVDEGYPATCWYEGLTDEIYCSVCYETIEEAQVIPKTAHTLVVDEGYPATCWYEGLTDEIYCSVCYETIEEAQTIPKKNHSYKTKVVAPTCTSKGYTLYTCSNCGESYKSNYTDPKGHKKVIDKAVPATFKSAGKTEGSHCSVCGKVIVAQKTIAKLGAPSLSSVTAGSKQFKATWKSVASIDGYQIQYSTSSAFSSGNKTVTVNGYKTTSKTIKNLKSKKKYYVRIRAYKTINGKKQYSSWSKSKSLTTKK